MGGLLGALAGLAAPLVARVLMALGFSVVTFTGVSAVFDQVKGMVTSYLGSAASAGVQIAGLAGVWVGLGLVFGAVSFGVALLALTKTVRIVAG